MKCFLLIASGALLVAMAFAQGEINDITWGNESEEALIKKIEGQLAQSTVDEETILKLASVREQIIAMDESYTPAYPKRIHNDTGSGEFNADGLVSKITATYDMLCSKNDKNVCPDCTVEVAGKGVNFTVTSFKC